MHTIKGCHSTTHETDGTQRKRWQSIGSLRHTCCVGWKQTCKWLRIKWIQHRTDWNAGDCIDNNVVAFRLGRQEYDFIRLIVISSTIHRTSIPTAATPKSTWTRNGMRMRKSHIHTRVGCTVINVGLTK
jgi:hypothetical protein